LVGQVAVNFFHNHHNPNSSELVSLKKVNPDSSYLSGSELGEGCKACSLDIIHDFFYHETLSFIFSHIEHEKKYNLCFISFSGISIPLYQGRAPPVL
jgi:hypothetical protein